ncbi:hypothetical protein LINPERPRIM_LOCUS16651 [Linum perenne]
MPFCYRKLGQQYYVIVSDFVCLLLICFFSVQDESRLVGNCFSGHIYDSSPVDFTSDWAVRSALPSIQKMPGPSKLMSWFTRGVTSGLDGLYLTRFEHQRTQYWQTLYSSVVS